MVFDSTNEANMWLMRKTITLFSRKSLFLSIDSFLVTCKTRPLELREFFDLQLSHEQMMVQSDTQTHALHQRNGRACFLLVLCVVKEPVSFPSDTPLQPFLLSTALNLIKVQSHL